MGATDTLDTLQRLREVLAKAESSESHGNSNTLLLRDQTLDLESEVAELSASLRHTAVSLIAAQQAATDAEARLAYAQELNGRLLSLLTQPSPLLDSDGSTFASASHVLPPHAGCAPLSVKHDSRLSRFVRGTAAICAVLAGGTCAACLGVLALFSVAASVQLGHQWPHPSLCRAPESHGCLPVNDTVGDGARRPRYGYAAVHLFQTAVAQLQLLDAIPVSSGAALANASHSSVLASAVSLFSAAPAGARLVIGLCMWAMAVVAAVAARRSWHALLTRALGLRLSAAAAVESDLAAAASAAPRPQSLWQVIGSFFGLRFGSATADGAEQTQYTTRRRVTMLRIALHVVCVAIVAVLAYGAAVALWLSLAYLASSTLAPVDPDPQASVHKTVPQALLPTAAFLLHPAAACLSAVAARTLSTAASLASARPRTLCGSASAARVLRRAVARLLGRKAATQAGLIGPAASTTPLPSSSLPLEPGTMDAELLAALVARKAAAADGNGSSDGRIARALYGALRVVGPLRTVVVPLARAALLLWLLHTVTLSAQQAQSLTAMPFADVSSCAAGVSRATGGDNVDAAGSSLATCDTNASASAAQRADAQVSIADARHGSTAVYCTAARALLSLGPADSPHGATNWAWLAASWQRLLLCAAPLVLLLIWLFLRLWASRRAVAAARLRRGEAVAAVVTKAAIRDAFTAAGAASAAAAAAASAAMLSSGGEGEGGSGPAQTSTAAAAAAQAVAAAVAEEGAALRAVAAIAEDRLQRAREAAATAAAAAWSVLAAVLLAALAVAVAGIVLAGAGGGGVGLCSTASTAAGFDSNLGSGSLHRGTASSTTGTTGGTTAQHALAAVSSLTLKKLAAAVASRAGMLAVLRALLLHPLPLAAAVLSDGLLAHAAAAAAASQGSWPI